MAGDAARLQERRDVADEARRRRIGRGGGQPDLERVGEGVAAGIVGILDDGEHRTVAGEHDLDEGIARLG